jgi:uncharacterized coiled-coil protein SlyX
MSDDDVIEELQRQLTVALAEIDRLRAQVESLERREALGSLLSH